MLVSFLTDSERDRLQRFPAEVSPDDVTAFFTLSASDVALVRKQRGEHNRLGFGLQLCMLRFLGFSLDDISQAPPPVVDYVCRQLNLEPVSLLRYGNRPKTRTVHLQGILQYTGFHTASRQEAGAASKWLVARALEHDKPSLLFQLLCQKLYDEKIIRPGITRLEKLVGTARAQAQEEIYRRVAQLLTPERCAFLDSLLVADTAANHTRHSWLAKGATSNTASAILLCLDKLAFLQSIGVAEWDLSELTPNRRKFLSQIAKRSTNQALQRMPPERRYPILLAFLKQSLIDITDKAIAIFDQCLWDCYNGAKNDLEAFKKDVYKSLNEKVRLLQEVGKLVLDPGITDQKLRATIFTHVSPEELQSLVEECQRIIRPVNDKYFDFLSRRYAYLQQFVPKFLERFAFHSNRTDDPLLEALTTLRHVNATSQRKLPPDAPLLFMPDDWTAYVIERDGKVNKRYYTLSTLWELRSSLRSGDVWVAHSRRYANTETYLIPKDHWEGLRSEVSQQMQVPENGYERLWQKRQELKELLTNAEEFFSGTGEVRIEQGKLVVPRLTEEELPASVQKLQEAITARLPRVEITDLLIEVGSWVNLPDYFTHAGGGEPRSPNLPVYLYASILAQAENLGLSQMANIANLSYEKLAWCTRWYIREETLKPAYTAFVNAHLREWLAKIWGDGTLSSSDGQRLVTVGKNRLAAAQPPYFGYGRGLTFYTWTSNQHSQFGTKPIRPTSRDATYVLDEILGNESELPLQNHTVDTAGFTEVDFALFSLLGRGFWPRLRDIGDQYLYRMKDLDTYPRVQPLLKAAIDEKLILSGYDEILRVAGSLQLGFVTASLFISKLQARPQQNMLTRVLQEYGKLEKTIFILRYIQDPVFRRVINLQLNKGEQLHSLRQFIHFANEGKIRSHLEEAQINEASCLNLVVNAIVLWNTIYMQAVIEQLRKEGYQISEEDLKHLSPARYEHINPYGHYTFNVQQELERKGLRPLRTP